MKKESVSLERIRERIKAELSDRSMTIQDLANATGISRVWISNVLGGKAQLSFADADAICEVFGTTLADLLTLEVSRNF